MKNDSQNYAQNRYIKICEVVSKSAKQYLTNGLRLEENL